MSNLELSFAFLTNFSIVVAALGDYNVSLSLISSILAEWVRSTGLKSFNSKGWSTASAPLKISTGDSACLGDFGTDLLRADERLDKPGYDFFLFLNFL